MGIRLSHLSRLRARMRAVFVRTLTWGLLTVGLLVAAVTLTLAQGSASTPTGSGVTLTQVVEDLNAGRVIEVAWSDPTTKAKSATAVAVVVTDTYSRAVTVPAPYAETFLANVVEAGVLVTEGVVATSKPGHPVSAANAAPVSDGNGDAWLISLLWVGFTIALGVCVFLWIRSSWRRNEAAAALRAEEQSATRAASLVGGADPALDADVETDVLTRFSDVAGCAEAVADLAEMVEYLKDPTRFTRLGAKTPRGALLAGPPGTGKTLLARAVAGEAGVAFISTSGSDFVEKFVGVGAQRIRDLFAKARTFEKAIVFIDEIDTIGRRRSTSDSGTNAESENTLTALLTELDGFKDRGDILVIAATNRADLLDGAVVRPGRLERRVEVPNPDRRGREQILAVHAQNRPLAAGVDLTSVARRTPGFSGAQMEAIVNEACMIAARADRDDVDQECFDHAVATIAMGRARTSALVTDFDREVTAWHEAGHALCAYLIPDADDPVQVTIVPRGPAGGVTWMTGSDDIYLRRRTAHARLVVAMGGRVGEELFLDGEYTQGAAGDLVAATTTATEMVTRYGMTDLGYVVRDPSVKNPEVLTAVNRLLEDAHARATDLLTQHRDFMGAVVAALLEEDTLTRGDIDTIADQFGVTATNAFELPAVPVRKSLQDLHKEPATEPDTLSGGGESDIIAPPVGAAPPLPLPTRGPAPSRTRDRAAAALVVAMETAASRLRQRVLAHVGDGSDRTEPDSQPELAEA